MYQNCVNWTSIRQELRHGISDFKWTINLSIQWQEFILESFYFHSTFLKLLIVFAILIMANINTPEVDNNIFI